MHRRTIFWMIVGALGTLAAVMLGSRLPLTSDAEFCEKRCPICTRARNGHRFARFLQTIELAVTGGGCPFGRARQRKYGVPPDQKLQNPGSERT